MGQTRVRKAKKGTNKTDEQTAGSVSEKIAQLKFDDDKRNESQHTSSVDNTSSESIPSRKLSNATKAVKAKSETSYIEVTDTETKGQAVFATRKIQPGTLILSDTPLIRLTQAQEDADKDTASTTASPPSLEAAFSSLPRPTQKVYLKLFDSKKSNYTPIASIYYSNCYNLSGPIRQSKSSPGGSCIGATASRINHSCVPNVQFSYDEQTNKMLFHAIKPIPKGREILSNYDSVYELRAQRQKKQSMYYGFTCDCEACNPQTEFWTRSDDRRRGMIEAKREIKECEKVFEQMGRVDVAHDPIHALERLENLLVKEGIVGIPLADHYRSAAKWAERRNDVKNLRRWKGREMEVCRVCLGEGAVRVVGIERRMEELS